MEGLTALVLGGTGEVGKVIVQELLNHSAFSKVKFISRRKPEVEHEKLQLEIVDFEKLDDYANSFKDAQVAFCCLGTTRGKAGASGFVKVDRDYVVNAAKILKENNCHHFHLVSSQGANKSSYFLYPKTKGEVEEQVTALSFPVLSIYRPAVLLCDRVESRPMEKIAILAIRAFDWRSKISVPTYTVANAMIANTLDSQSSNSEEKVVNIYDNADILRLGLD